jgi:hypothetical protein
VDPWFNFFLKSDESINQSINRSFFNPRFKVEKQKKTSYVSNSQGNLK